MVSHVFCFTLYALVPKIHKSLLIPERKYFNERKHMHSLCLRRRSSRNFRFFTVNSQREYTLEIDFFLLELDVGSCLMCSASVWPRFNKTLRSMADFIHVGI